MNTPIKEHPTVEAHQESYATESIGQKFCTMTHALLRLVPIVALAMAGCAVGPNYKRPTTDTPSHYKAEALGSWKEGQPGDHVPKGDWWKMFGDETLNDLQSRAAGANQELKAAIARVEQARATARVARSELLPTLNADPSGFHPIKCRASAT